MAAPIQFKPGFDDGSKRNLQEDTSWDDSPLRCLHLCFLPRSSADTGAVRENIMEIYRGGLLRRLLRPFQKENTNWKREHYRQGPVVTVDTRPFFPA